MTEVLWPWGQCTLQSAVTFSALRFFLTQFLCLWGTSDSRVISSLQANTIWATRVSESVLGHKKKMPQMTQKKLHFEFFQVEKFWKPLLDLKFEHGVCLFFNARRIYLFKKKNRKKSGHSVIKLKWSEESSAVLTSDLSSWHSYRH